jgi:hypothetical protein
MLQNSMIFSLTICKIFPGLNKSKYFTGFGAILIAVSLILLILLYFMVCRKFDKIIKNKIKDPYFLDLLFNLYGLPVHDQIFRTSVYSSFILFNYIDRYKKLQESKKQNKKPGISYIIFFRKIEYWCQMFEGYDFYKNSSKFQKMLVYFFVATASITLLWLLLCVFNQAISHYYCGIPPSPP